LPSGQVNPMLQYMGIIPGREASDKIMYTCNFRCGLNFFRRRAGHAKTMLVTNQSSLLVEEFS